MNGGWSLDELNDKREKYVILVNIVGPFGLQAKKFYTWTISNFEIGRFIYMCHRMYLTITETYSLQDA